ncbi:hypothetical protein AYY26_16370 [Photobacterium phosphoreum]|nr:hypothetical protein AYY26_16370 [Photobacterium phosphoreum]
MDSITDPTTKKNTQPRMENVPFYYHFSFPYFKRHFRWWLWLHCMDVAIICLWSSRSRWLIPYFKLKASFNEKQ